MVQPINIIFRYLQQKTKVSLWLYDNTDMRIEGIIIVSRLADSLAYGCLAGSWREKSGAPSCAAGWSHGQQPARTFAQFLVNRVFLSPTLVASLRSTRLHRSGH